MLTKDLEIELTSFIDDKQNVWFRGKDVATILGYSDTNQAIRWHVHENYKKSYPIVSTGKVRYQYFISEPGFYWTGYSPRYSHLPVNMANTNYLIVPGIT